MGYLTTEKMSHDLIAVVKDWLKADLPDYMVPSQFVVLEKLSLTFNRKIDRKTLPALDANVLGENSLAEVV